jgi:hypothetical protein
MLAKDSLKIVDEYMKIDKSIQGLNMRTKDEKQLPA